MRQLFGVTGKSNLQMFARLVMISLFLLLLISCRKDAINYEPVTEIGPIKNFRISASKLVLLQGNAAYTALSLKWELSGEVAKGNIKYTIESAIDGSNFADPVDLGSTDQHTIRLTVKECNRQILNLINAGSTGIIAIRIRAESNYSKLPVVYSEAIALEVTPYQYFKVYEDSQIMKIPGNYQNWNLLIAPSIISANNTGEYEGYIKFANPYAQFLFVKGTKWDPRLTYTHIGANKFGFGGTMLSIFGGAGVYLLRANINTNTWGYTKINSWGLHGAAIANTSNVNQDKMMVYDESNLSWVITANLIPGDFRFRANNANDINFGHNCTEEIGVPNYNGENIHIAKPGIYTISLHLQSAGNYAYTIKKNS